LERQTLIKRIEPQVSAGYTKTVPIANHGFIAVKSANLRKSIALGILVSIAVREANELDAKTNNYVLLNAA